MAKVKPPKNFVRAFIIIKKNCGFNSIRAFVIKRAPTAKKKQH
jgi:hypothetical protein